MTARSVAVVEKRPSWAKELDDREFLFVFSYLGHFNGTRAALDAGCPKTSAHAEAWRLKQRPHVRDAIDAGLREKMPALKLGLAERLMAIVDQKATDYYQWGAQTVTETVGDGFDKDGKPRFKIRKVKRQTLTLTPSSKLTLAQLAAVKGVKKRVNNAGTTLELQLHCPVNAIEKMVEILGLGHEDKKGGAGNVAFIIELPDGTVVTTIAQAAAAPSSIDRSAIDAQIAADAEPIEDLPPGAKPQSRLVIETP